LVACNYHTPVLLKETISLLLTSRSGIYLDATFGGGGHSRAILDALDNTGKVIALDVDEDALKEGEKIKASYGDRLIVTKANYREVKKIIHQYGFSKVDGVLFDLGVSSYQLSRSQRGFSFQLNEKLDMRMDQTQEKNARYIVNTYSRNLLAEIFMKYGEERNAGRIAKAIVEARNRSPIETTGELVEIIKKVARGKYLTKSLARIFQAIRIEVNNELENLKLSLEDSVDLLNKGGRLAVISYHSLEDRIVKQFFRNMSTGETFSKMDVYSEARPVAMLRLITRKPIVPTKEEVKENPRSRSAKLRVAEKVG